jgi:hypothetical protein
MYFLNYLFDLYFIYTLCQICILSDLAQEIVYIWMHIEIIHETLEMVILSCMFPRE